MVRYISAEQLAERYSVDRSTIWRWAARGALPRPVKLSAPVQSVAPRRDRTARRRARPGPGGVALSRAKRSLTGERFAMLPLSVMISPAFKTLPVGYQRVLWLLAAQYDGGNNGDLSLTRKQAAHFGLSNERHR